MKFYNKFLAVKLNSLLFDEKHLETGIHQVGNERTVVSSHSLNTLAVHFVVLVRPCVVQACIPLFVDEKIRPIHLNTFTKVCS
jgi:hypothetical protein